MIHSWGVAQAALGTLVSWHRKNAQGRRPTVPVPRDRPAPPPSIFEPFKWFLPLQQAKKMGYTLGITSNTNKNCGLLTFSPDTLCSIYIYIYTRSVNKHGYIWPNKWWQYTGTICGGLHPFKLHSSEDTTSNIFHFVLFLPSGISTIPRTTIWTSIVFQGVGNPRKPPQWLQLNRHLKWWLGPSWGLVGFNVLFFKKKKGFEDS